MMAEENDLGFSITASLIWEGWKNSTSLFYYEKNWGWRENWVTQLVSGKVIAERRLPSSWSSSPFSIPGCFWVWILMTEVSRSLKTSAESSYKKINGSFLCVLFSNQLASDLLH